jgi:hypothetical protein
MLDLKGVYDPTPAMDGGRIVERAKGRDERRAEGDRHAQRGLDDGRYIDDPAQLADLCPDAIAGLRERVSASA